MDFVGLLEVVGVWIAAYVAFWAVIRKDKKDCNNENIAHAKKHTQIDSDLNNIYTLIKTIKESSDKAIDEYKKECNAIIKTNKESSDKALDEYKKESNDKYNKLETDVYDELKSHRAIIEKQYDKMDAKIVLMTESVNSEMRLNRETMNKILIEIIKIKEG